MVFQHSEALLRNSTKFMVENDFREGVREVNFEMSTSVMVLLRAFSSTFLDAPDKSTKSVLCSRLAHTRNHTAASILRRYHPVSHGTRLLTKIWHSAVKLQHANLSANGRYLKKILAVQMHVRTLSLYRSFPSPEDFHPSLPILPHLPRFSLTHTDGRFTTCRQLPKLAQCHFAFSVGENSVEGSTLSCGARQDVGVCWLPLSAVSVGSRWYCLGMMQL